MSRLAQMQDERSETEAGWRYIDLELDPVLHERDCSVEIEDWPKTVAETPWHLNSASCPSR
jgi:hypothetical protein